MKKYVILFFFLAYSLQISSQEYSQVIDSVSFESKVLGMKRKYAIYLPPDYKTSTRTYPVLYLLHGATDDQTGWVQFGDVKRITDAAIQSGKSGSMIIVMPDADTGQMGYNNSANGKWRYEDFFFTELIPHIEKSYRVKSNKRYRAVAGLSMGGGGTFIYALHRPDMFAAACPLSAYLGPLTKDDASWLTRIALKDANESEIQAYFEKYSVIHQLNNNKEEDLKSVKWYIDCGDDDFLFEGNALAHIAMSKRKIPHEYRVRDGAHNWTYWRESLPEVLAFVSESFRQK